MNEFQWVGLITIIACLILMFGEFRQQDYSGGKGWKMVAAWIGLFVGTALVFGTML